MRAGEEPTLEVAGAYKHKKKEHSTNSYSRNRPWRGALKRNDSETHPASYPIGTRGFSLEGGRVKRPGSEVDHSPTTSADVMNIWIYTSTPPYVFMF
jgi:hypothetical protein